MPNSLRSKLSSLRYKRLLTDEEYEELIKKLEGHDREIRNKAIDEVFDFLKTQRGEKYKRVNFDDLEIRKYKEQLKAGGGND